MGATTESRVFNVLAASITRRAGGFDLLVRTGTASCTLHFSPSLATGLLVLPREHVGVPPRHKSGRPAPALPPERRALYVQVYAHWRTVGGTQHAACSAHAVPYHAFQSWFNTHRAEVVAEFNAAPVVKPNGKIL